MHSPWDFAYFIHDSTRVVGNMAHIETEPCSVFSTFPAQYGEFYIAPVFNYAIAAGWNIKAYGVRRMLSMGTPEDLAETIKVLEREA